MPMITFMDTRPMMAMRIAGSTSMMPMESWRMPGIAAVMIEAPADCQCRAAGSGRMGRCSQPGLRSRAGMRTPAWAG